MILIEFMFLFVKQEWVSEEYLFLSDVGELKIGGYCYISTSALAIMQVVLLN